MIAPDLAHDERRVTLRCRCGRSLDARVRLHIPSREAWLAYTPFDHRQRTTLTPNFDMPTGWIWDGVTQRCVCATCRGL